MANFELKFKDFCDNSTITVNVNLDKNKKEMDSLRIILSDNNGDEGVIDLDKSTAIKFAKTLRTEINKITGSEVSNG